MRGIASLAVPAALALAGCGPASEGYLVERCGPPEDSAGRMHCCITAPPERWFEQGNVYRENACAALALRAKER